MPSALKQELLEKIAATEDERLLLLLNDDFDYFSQHTQALDITGNLSTTQLAELIELLNEPFGHETEAYGNFTQATARWHTR